MIIVFLSAAILTVLIEVLAAFVIGYRKIFILLLVVAVNFITNPLLNLAIYLFYSIGLFSIPILIILEIIVVFTEFLYYKRFAGLDKNRSLNLSVILNTVSLLIGLCLTVFF